MIQETPLDWPTLRGLTYDRFRQDIENNVFSMLTEISSVIYQLACKSGRYKDDLWDKGNLPLTKCIINDAIECNFSKLRLVSSDSDAVRIPATALCTNASGQAKRTIH